MLNFQTGYAAKNLPPKAAPVTVASPTSVTPSISKTSSTLDILPSGWLLCKRRAAVRFEKRLPGRNAFDSRACQSDFFRSSIAFELAGRSFLDWNWQVASRSTAPRYSAQRSIIGQDRFSIVASNEEFIPSISASRSTSLGATDLAQFCSSGLAHCASTEFICSTFSRLINWDFQHGSLGFPELLSRSIQFMMSHKA